MHHIKNELVSFRDLYYYKSKIKYSLPSMEFDEYNPKKFSGKITYTPKVGDFFKIVKLEKDSKYTYLHRNTEKRNLPNGIIVRVPKKDFWTLFYKNDEFGDVSFHTTNFDEFQFILNYINHNSIVKIEDVEEFYNDDIYNPPSSYDLHFYVNMFPVELAEKSKFKFQYYMCTVDKYGGKTIETKILMRKSKLEKILNHD